MSGAEREAARRRFPPRPSSVREARQMIRASLVEAGRDDLVETAELLVSEIVTNALVHAGTPIDVAFTLAGRGLRVEVSDGSPHAPTVRGYGPSAGTGRGLMLLEEMVDDWGVLPGDPGKTVWFQLASPVGGEIPGSTRAAPPEAETVTVRLLEVPLLLHEAWRQHAESLLRELLLASLDDELDADPIELHAEASDAIAILAEHVPASGVPDDPDRVMVAATEPLVTHPIVEVPVPASSVPHFATLDTTIRTALEMAEDGRLLTPATQPEVQALRGWLCGQVAAQAEGAAPRPWVLEVEPPRRPAPPPAGDLEALREAETALVVADEEDLIVGASPAALSVLGYDDPQDLVGRRLVAVIPERYRQAHLAGFTLHTLTGRSTLVGHPVVVPALRRGGTEVEVTMTVRRDRGADGRSVFVAELVPVEPD